MSDSQVQWMFNDAGVLGEWSVLAKVNNRRWSDKMNLKQSLESLHTIKEEHAKKPVRFYITQQHEAKPKTLISHNKQEAIAALERMMAEDAPSDRVSRLCQQEPVEETKAELQEARGAGAEEQIPEQTTHRTEDGAIEHAMQISPAGYSSPPQPAVANELQCKGLPAGCEENLEKVEFVFKSSAEIQRKEITLIDTNLTLHEVRRVLNVPEEACFMKNGKKYPSSKETSTILDKVAEDDEEDSLLKRVSIECQPTFSKVSKHGIFLDASSGLKEYLYENKDFTPQQLAAAKVLIVLGGTGSGKTTLLNTLVTYTLGVRRHDEFRYRIVDDRGKDQTKSVTSEVTMYYVEETDRAPPLLIIDTPGFGDCDGVEVDKKIFAKIKSTFETQIDQIHAVCFVGKAPDERLTGLQEYILQNVVKLFGKDIAKNFVTMATFCDGGRVLIKNALENSNFFQPIVEAGEHKLYEFNNSAVFNDPKTSGDLHEQFWSMGMNSMERFVNDFLRNVEPSSLQKTRENLKQRKQIEDNTFALQKNSELLQMQKLALEQERATIEAAQHRINEGEKFEYWTEKFESEKVDCAPGKMVTHCLICAQTCHDDCPFPNGEKYKCFVFHKHRDFGWPREETYAKGCCKCPKGCGYHDHTNSGVIIKTVKKRVKMTDAKLKSMYVDASSKKSAAEQILAAKQREINILQCKDLMIHMEIQESMEVLAKVALKKDTYTASAKYYRNLIELEEAKPQTPLTVRRIQDLTRNAEYEEQLARHSQHQIQDLRTQMQEMKKTLKELEDSPTGQEKIIAKVKKERSQSAAGWIVKQIFG